MTTQVKNLCSGTEFSLDGETYQIVGMMWHSTKVPEDKRIGKGWDKEGIQVVSVAPKLGGKFQTSDALSKWIRVDQEVSVY
jgi:hypothetical protein